MVPIWTRQHFSCVEVCRAPQLAPFDSVDVWCIWPFNRGLEGSQSVHACSMVVRDVAAPAPKMVTRAGQHPADPRMRETARSRGRPMCHQKPL